jgi:hypothetical protein
MDPAFRSVIAAPSAALVFLCALVFLSVPSAAQVRTAYPEKRGVALSEFPRTIKLAENV